MSMQQALEQAFVDAWEPPAGIDDVVMTPFPVEHDDMTLAIVGPRALAPPPRGLAEGTSGRNHTTTVHELCGYILGRYAPRRVTSGGAPGTDTIARTTAEVLGYRLGVDFIELLPKHNRWEPDGYKARNINIAETCTHLVCFQSEYSTTFGSGWTADYAEKELNKPVLRIYLPTGRIDWPRW